MSIFTDSYSNSDYINTNLGSEIVNGELRPVAHDNGTVLTFNGSTQYGTAVGYKGVTGTSARTTMCWFKTEATAGVLYYFGANSGVAVQYQVTIETNAVLYLRMGGNVIRWGDELRYNLNDGQWHHLAIVNTSSPTTSNFTLYLDGVAAPSTIEATTGAVINLTAQADVSVGARKESVNPAANYFAGEIEDLRLYNTALTADDIFGLVKGGVEPSTSNLQAHWLFNDGAGSTINDETANNRDITLVNSPTWSSSAKPFYGLQSRTTSTSLLTGADVSSIENFDYILSRKSAGHFGKLQFSDDGSSWVNANGDSVTGYGSYFFDGVNDQISCGSNSAIDNIFATGGTWMAWVWARTHSYNFANAGHIFHKDPAGDNTNATKLQLAGGSIVFLRDFSGSDGIWRAEWELPYFTWVHIAVTYNESSTSNTPLLYVNGVLRPFTDNTPPTGTANSDASHSLYIGSRNGDNYWDGYIADARIYKGDILSADTIYNYVFHSIEPSETLDAHWKFNGNPADEVGLSTGLVFGASPKTNFFQSPPVGNSTVSANNRVLDFDGINDQVSIPDNNVFSFGNGSTDTPFSVAAWCYMEDATLFKIVGKNDNSTTSEWLFHTTGTDNLSLFLYDPSTGNSLAFTEFLGVTHYENQWVHFAATYDGSSNASGIKLYINGQEAPQGADTSSGGYVSMENTSQPVQIGARGSGQWASGRIANVSIWSDVRTQAEIIEEVEAGFADLNDANIIAHWILNDEGSVAADALGNHNGTISGATSFQDIDRPQIIAVTSGTIDVSGLSFTDIYYRYNTFGVSPNFTTGLSSVGTDFTTIQTILVRDDESSVIDDGEATPQSFGSTTEGEASPTLTFTIQNIGEALLTISSINLPSGYSISGDTPTTIAGTSSDTFTVSLSTATIGTYSGDVEINSDDPDTATYNFAIIGEIIAASSDVGNICNITHGFFDDRRESLQRLKFLRTNTRKSLKTVLC